MTSLADDLLLTLVDPATGKFRTADPKLGYGLAGALLVELVLAALVVAATAALVVALATRIYERSLLQTGGRTGWAAALRGGRPSPAVPEGA